MAWTALYYHIVFATKDRRPFLTGERLPRLCEYSAGILRNIDCHLVCAGGIADHVHLAVELHTTKAVAEAVRTVKTNTSRWTHDVVPELRDFNWQESYAAFSVSKSVLPDVVSYIKRQEDHHRAKAYVDELRALLEKHGVQYDERYLA